MRGENEGGEGGNVRGYREGCEGVGRGGRHYEGVGILCCIVRIISHMRKQFSVMCLHGNLCMFVVETVREWGVYCNCNIF